MPADPEGERSAEDFGREDTQKRRQKPEEHRSSGLEEDGVRKAERESERVNPDVDGDRPMP